jgi:hypothetical protein
MLNVDITRNTPPNIVGYFPRDFDMVVGEVKVY